MGSKEITYRQHMIIGVTTFTEILGITSYGLRLLSRHLSRSGLWYDDYVMGIGLIFASIPGICNLVGLRYGLGKHVFENNEEATKNFLICFYVLQMSYVSTLPTVKIAVLLFYRRIFPSKAFRWALYMIGTFLLLFLLSSLLTSALQCLPISSFWQPSVKHHCIDQVKFYIVHGSLNFVSDLFVVLMPMPILWRLHLPAGRKWKLLVLFLLGGLACAISLARIVSLQEVDPEDITWSNVNPGLWSTSEAGVVVLSANLPSMNPIFKRLHPKSLSHAKYTPKDEESSHILEYLDLSGHKTERAVRASPQRTGLSTTAVHTADNGKTASALPDNGILVEMGLEQSVRNM